MSRFPPPLPTPQAPYPLDYGSSAPSSQRTRNLVGWEATR
jgi:hypothetical protein